MFFVKSVHDNKAVNMEQVVYTDVVKNLEQSGENDLFVLRAHTVLGKVIPIAYGNIPEALHERQKRLFRLVEVPNGYMENEYCDLCDEEPYVTRDETEIPF